ncbi:MAG: hypothetical protein ABL884_08210 [Methyloglobulus sp.]
MKDTYPKAVFLTALVTFSIPASANDDADALALKLQNPVANLISVPIQNNWDFGIGPADTMRYTVNIQPVIPFKLNDELNLITRTIVPIIHAESPVTGGSSISGMGDIVQSFFLSPAKPTASGIIWGAGPVFLYPSATDDRLGTEKFGLGPTAVLLRQQGPWTYGGLANHIWSVTGNQQRADISATFLNPFLSYTTSKQTTYSLSTDSTYDWESNQWLVPVQAGVSQLMLFGTQPVQFSGSARYYAEAPKGGPDWGLRFSVTLLFPK